MTGPNAILTAMIADDEPPARRHLLRLIHEHPEIAVTGEASTGIETVELLRDRQPDVLFLDVRMPGLDGFQVLETLGNLEDMAVVFVTAFDEYAVRAFEVQAVDYLLKPVTRERLARVLDRVRGQVQARATSSRSVSEPSPKYWKRILVRGPRVTQFVDVSTVDWIEADRNYVVLHCGEVEHLIRTTIESFVAGLDPQEFARINRSVAVNLSRVLKLLPSTHGDYALVLRSGIKLSCTRRYASDALGRFQP